MNGLWRIRYLPDWFKRLFRFIRRIHGYYKLDRDWEYEPDTYTFIINNYSEVLCSRTHFMSKPTYYAKDIISQLDDFYAERDTGHKEKAMDISEKMLCQANRKDNGQLVVGYYFCMHHNDDRKHIHHFIIPLEADLSKGTPIDKIQVEIDPNSVTQVGESEQKKGEWISVKDRMPEERESIFAKYKGTDKWRPAMFERSSEDVRIIEVFEDGTRRVHHSHTIDGKWANEMNGLKRTVTHWMPNPELPEK